MGLLLLLTTPPLLYTTLLPPTTPPLLSTTPLPPITLLPLSTLPWSTTLLPTTPPPVVHAPVVHHAPVVAKVVAHPVAAPAYHAPAPAYHPAEKEVPAPYAYEYGVADDYSKAQFNAAETADANGAVTGSYSVALPDGRTQHVKYTADHYNGYVADVSYEGVPVYPEAKPYHPAPAPAYHA